MNKYLVIKATINSNKSTISVAIIPLLDLYEIPITNIEDSILELSVYSIKDWFPINWFCISKTDNKLNLFIEDNSKSYMIWESEGNLEDNKYLIPPKIKIICDMWEISNIDSEPDTKANIYITFTALGLNTAEEIWAESINMVEFKTLLKENKKAAN